MNEMKRRYFLQMSAFGFTVGLPGCQRFTDADPTTTESYNQIMAIFPKVKKVSDGWSLEAQVVNEYPQHTSFHDIQLLAYTADGSKICEAKVGDLLKPTGDAETVETTCSEFPAIITATARESPCEKALIPVDYWVGTDAQKTTTLASDEIVWKDTYRKCDEELPPQRILDEFKTSTEEH